MPTAMALALTLITLAALCAIVMMMRNRGGWVSATLVLGLVLVGVLLLLRTSRARGPRSVAAREKTIVLDDHWGRTEVPLGPGRCITSAEWPGTARIDETQRGKLQLGVRLEDGKLVVGGFAAVEEPPAAQPGQPAPPLLSEIDRDELERSLREVVEQTVARKLDEFFDRLAAARDVEPELAPLRAALRPLRAAERRGLALRLARHRDELTRKTALCDVQNISLPGLLGIELALFPEGISTLAQTSASAGSPPPQPWSLPTHSTLPVAISALVVATFVLKVATRRHVAQPGR